MANLIQSNFNPNCYEDMGRVLIAGASGMIGSAIKAKLQMEDRSYIQLSSSQSSPNNGIYQWQPDGTKDALSSIPQDVWSEVDTIINLSGASIGKGRWTKNRKKVILDSRILSTLSLVEAVNANPSEIKQFINASAVGYYPDSSKPVDENSGHGSDFISNVCVKWEAATNALRPGIESSIIRIGVVLGQEGFLAPIKKYGKLMGFISMGKGKQMVSWIHIDDLVSLFSQILNGAIPSGVYNGTSPAVSDLNELTSTISHICGGFKWPFNVPSFVLKIVLGEMSELILKSTHAQPKNAQKAGFKFMYPSLEQTLKSVL